MNHRAFIKKIIFFTIALNLILYCSRVQTFGSLGESVFINDELFADLESNYNDQKPVEADTFEEERSEPERPEPEPAQPTPMIIHFNSIPPEEAKIEVQCGTPVYQLPLPTALGADIMTMIDGEANYSFTDVSITWMSEPEYDENIMGDYIFSPRIEEEYELYHDMEIPTVQISVLVQGSKETIMSFMPLSLEESEKEVLFETDLEDLQLPQVLVAELQILEDEGDNISCSEIPVTWAAAPEYNGKIAGKYLFSPIIEGYKIDASVDLPMILITVLPNEDTVIGMNKPLILGFAPLPPELAALDVPYGTSLEKINLPESLSADIMECTGEEVQNNRTEVAVTWISEPGYDSGIPGEYLFSPIIEHYDISVSTEKPTIQVVLEGNETIVYNGITYSVVPVSTDADFKRAVRGEYGYSNICIQLQDNVTLDGTAGINGYCIGYTSPIQNLMIDGQRDETRNWTLTDNDNNNVLIYDASLHYSNAALSSVTFRNLEITGQNYTGVLGSGITTVSVTAAFENVTYTGPQLLYAPYSDLILKNCAITLNGYNTLYTGKVGEMASVTLQDHVAISNSNLFDDPQLPIFRVGRLVATERAFITVAAGANVNITTPNVLFTTDRALQNFTVEKHATLLLDAGVGVNTHSSIYAVNDFTLEEYSVFKVTNMSKSNILGNPKLAIRKITVKPSASLWMESSGPAGAGNNVLIRLAQETGSTDFLIEHANITLKNENNPVFGYYSVNQIITVKADEITLKDNTNSTLVVTKPGNGLASVTMTATLAASPNADLTVNTGSTSGDIAGNLINMRYFSAVHTPGGGTDDFANMVQLPVNDTSSQIVLQTDAYNGMSKIEYQPSAGGTWKRFPDTVTTWRAGADGKITVPIPAGHEILTPYTKLRFTFTSGTPVVLAQQPAGTDIIIQDTTKPNVPPQGDSIRILTPVTGTGFSDTWFALPNGINKTTAWVKQSNPGVPDGWFTDVTDNAQNTIYPAVYGTYQGYYTYQNDHILNPGTLHDGTANDRFGFGGHTLSFTIEDTAGNAVTDCKVRVFFNDNSGRVTFSNSQALFIQNSEIKINLSEIKGYTNAVLSSQIIQRAGAYASTWVSHDSWTQNLTVDLGALSAGQSSYNITPYDVTLSYSPTAERVEKNIKVKVVNDINSVDIIEDTHNQYRIHSAPGRIVTIDYIDALHTGTPVMPFHIGGTTQWIVPANGGSSCSDLILDFSNSALKDIVQTPYTTMRFHFFKENGVTLMESIDVVVKDTQAPEMNTEPAPKIIGGESLTLPYGNESASYVQQSSVAVSKPLFTNVKDNALQSKKPKITAMLVDTAGNSIESVSYPVGPADLWFRFKDEALNISLPKKIRVFFDDEKNTAFDQSENFAMYAEDVFIPVNDRMLITSDDDLKDFILGNCNLKVWHWKESAAPLAMNDSNTKFEVDFLTSGLSYTSTTPEPFEVAIIVTNLEDSAEPKQSVRKNISVILEFKNILTILQAPRNAKFFTNHYSFGERILPRIESTWESFSVFNGNNSAYSWYMTASASIIKTDSDHILPGYLVYHGLNENNEYGRRRISAIPSDGTDPVVMVYNSTWDSLKEFSPITKITWPQFEGILLNVDFSQPIIDEPYKTTITWTLVNGP